MGSSVSKGSDCNRDTSTDRLVGESLVQFQAELRSREDPGLSLLLQRQEEAWAQGQPIPIEQLLADLPTSSAEMDGILELVHNEVVLREIAGQIPNLADYQARFPQAADALREQWEIDALFEEDGFDAEDEDPLHRIGRYQIQEEIGRGAMGIVYRAWDPRLKRVVAIKRLRGGADASPQERKRIRTEAEAIARVRHDGVVQIHDIGDHEGQPYLAMEYCGGGSLATRLAHQSLADRVSAELVAKIAAGIAAAHAAQVLHRDLKPANVLLTETATLNPKVTDFGLAKQLDAEDQATATGGILGTPAYMAPEQALGNAKSVGPSADVYALGAILYECLTGRPPFRAASVAETLDQVRHREPVPVRQLQPNAAIDLETIAHKCLRKDPADRYPSADAVVQDLQRFLNHEPILARRETWLQAAVRVYRRYPVTSTLATIAAGLLLVVAFGSLLFAQRLDRARIASEKSEREARLGQADALLGRAHGIRLSGRPGHRFDALAAIGKAVAIGRELGQPAPWYAPLRDEAIAALLLPDAYVRTWRRETYPPASGDYSDDHRLYAITFKEVGDILLRRMKDDKELGRIPKIDTITRVQFVANDRLLLVGLTSFACEMWEVREADATTAEPVAIQPRRLWRLESGCQLYDVTPNGETLAMTDVHHLRVFDAQSGDALAEMPVAPFARDAVVNLHPTKPLVLLSAYMQSVVHLRDWKTKETIQELRPGEGTEDYPGYTGAAWSPDGERLVVVNGEESAQHWYRLDPVTHQLALDRVERPIRAQFGGGPVLRFNAQGDRLLGIGWNPRLSILDPRDGALICTTDSFGYGGGHNVRPPRIYSQGTDAGFAGRTDDLRQFGVISIADGREAFPVIPAHKNVSMHTAFDPSGRILVGGLPHGLIFVDAYSGQSILELPIRNLTAIWFAFDRLGGFVMNGPSGCYHWPCRITPSEEDARTSISMLRTATLHLGMPRRIHVPTGTAVYIACDDRGETFAAAAANGLGSQEYAGCWIQTPEEPATRKIVGGFSGTSCAVSPNGRYVVGTYETMGNVVWDCERDLELIHKLGDGTTPVFSKDGAWLTAAGQRFSTIDWKSNVRFPESAPQDLSSDGTLAVTSRDDGTFALNDASTGRILARFDGRDPWKDVRFSPAGKRISAWSKNAVYMIDLGRVRQGLVELGLDWDAPASVPNRHGRISGHQVEGSIDSDDLHPATTWSVELAPELAAIETADELADLVDRQALDRAASQPNNLNVAFSAGIAAADRADFPRALRHLDRAREIAADAITPRLWQTYVLAAMRDYSRAIEGANEVIALKASKESPIDQDFRLLRAEWHYQAGHFKEAIDDCSYIIDLNVKWSKFAYGLRAACHEALGDLDRARSDQSQFVELTRFDAKSLNMASDTMTGRDISLRHPTIALRVVRKIQSLPEELSEEVEHTIGRVLYRNDHFEECATWIEQSITRGQGALDGFDLLVLGMARHQLGQIDAAREVLARARAWQPSKPLDFHQGRQFQALAAEARALETRP